MQKRKVTKPVSSTPFNITVSINMKLNKETFLYKVSLFSNTAVDYKNIIIF